MRVLLALVTAVASVDSEEEVGLLQQRLSVGEGSKAEVDLDLDCRQGPKNCVKATTTTTTTIASTCKDFVCSAKGWMKKDDSTLCATSSCSWRECCTPQRTTTTTMMTKPTTAPSGDFEQCRVWGDPQVTSFDELISARFFCRGRFWDDKDVDSYKNGDYYLLRSDEVVVQGRFGSGMGSTRSMQREVAMQVGGEILQIKPHAIYYQGKECGSGSNQGLNSGDEIGKFKVVKMSGGLVVLHESVPEIKLWLQQVGASSPAVQAIIFKAKGALSNLAGLCGDADGDKANDCDAMIGETNKVDKEKSLFMAAPFEFAGCSDAEAVKWEWRTMGAKSSADDCALSCKGFGETVYYPEFYIKKSIQFPNSVDCFCANLKESQNTAWKRWAMKPDDLKKLSKRKGSCSSSACSASHPKFGSDAICIFKETEAVQPKECDQTQRREYYKKCQNDPNFQGDAVHQCVSDMCASDDPDAQEMNDGNFMQEADEEVRKMKTMFSMDFKMWKR